MKLMMDILVLALWSDTTRIATMMTADAQTNEDYSFLPGVKGGFHSISHHAEEPARKKQYETMRQLARRAGRLFPEAAQVAG